MTLSPITVFKTLRDANQARQNEWDQNDQIDWDWRCNELAGEAGEVCNVLKKLYREKLGIKGSRATVDDLADELADVMICLDLCAMTAGFDALWAETPFEGKYRFERPFGGKRLANAIGRICDYPAPSNFAPARKNDVDHWMHDAARCCETIAAAYGINLDTATARKFNATSEKVGLSVRYEPES